MRLTIHNVQQIDDLVFKDIKGNLSKDSSIMEIFVDFKQIPPMIIEDHAKAIQIREIMKNEHVRMKIVVDENNHFKGILPLSCLSEEKFTKKMMNDGFDKDSLLVKHCMVEKKHLQALDYNDITHATIGDVIEALQHIGHNYCLVIDHKEHQIRGVISANDISRALGVSVNIAATGVGTTFVDIFKGLMG